MIKNVKMNKCLENILNPYKCLIFLRANTTSKLELIKWNTLTYLEYGGQSNIIFEYSNRLYKKIDSIRNKHV